jgi:7-keto-8-aminopelargonate synthetase-like enzyme
MGPSLNCVTTSTASKLLLAGKAVVGPVSARMMIDGREYLNFCGSGYLALSNVPEIRDAVRRVFEEGAPFAQPLSASLGAIDPIFASVEREGAAACGAGATVYFASGFLIGAIGMASLDQDFDLILLDEDAHFNLKDAARLSGRPVHIFSHCNTESLREKLKHRLTAGQRPLIVTDGAFATTGRIPPLVEYADELAAYEGHLFIDESHAFGVVGENGRGAAEYCAVERLATIGSTLSKAFCAQGAIVATTPTMAQRLRTMPAVIGANAGSPLSAAAAAASLAYVAAHPELRSELRMKADYLRERLRGAGLPVIDTPAPIVSFKWGSRADMQALQRRLFESGIYIHHSSYVGAGPEGVIRCAIFRDHSRGDIDALVSRLN